MHFFTTLSVLLLSISFTLLKAGTPIQVSSDFKDQLNIKIQGSGVGGCDILMSKGESNDACWCLWGTINYSFCAYKKSPLGEAANNATELAKEDVKSGRCPVVTGESLVCSDLSSLGNCYDKAYSCSVNSNGLCHCDTV